MKVYPVAIIITLFGSVLLAGTPPGGGKGAPGFDKLKSLVGVWEGKDKEGNPVTVSYKLVSAGTSLMETMDMAEHKESMVTMYHVDGDKLMLTHYCSVGNQPRMRAERIGDKDSNIAFSFIDGTNISSAADARMHKLVLTFVDNDHLTHEWTMRKDGKDTPPVTFQLQRVKG